MARPESDRNAEVREVLIDAVEVQLAAIKAAVSFWAEWAERTSGFVSTAARSLDALRSPDKNPRDVLLEVVDVGRESMRAMTELPRNAAARFIDELEGIAGKRQTRRERAPKPPPANGAAPGAPPKAARARRRRARVKP
jgi:hypothetical protein